MSNKLRMLCASLILLAMSACAIDSTAPGAVSNYCRIAQPISYDSVSDSPETVKAVEEHNSKYVCVCEGDCPKQPEEPPSGRQVP